MGPEPSEAQFFHPFIGREDSLKELETQVIDPNRPAQRALYVSGNFGTGRRTLVRKFYQNQYPQVGRAFPTVRVEEFDSAIPSFFIVGKLQPQVRYPVEGCPLCESDGMGILNCGLRWQVQVMPFRPFRTLILWSKREKTPKFGPFKNEGIHEGEETPCPKMALG